MTDTDLPPFDSRGFRTTLDEFSSRLNAYVKTNTKAITQAKAAFETESAQLFDRRRQLQIQLQEENLKQNHVSDVAKAEAKAALEIRSALRDLSRLKEQKRTEISDLEMAVQRQLRCLQQTQSLRDDRSLLYGVQRGDDLPELAVWEDILGVRIQGTGRAGTLKVQYCFPRLLDSSHGEVFFIFRLANDRTYEVMTLRPKLPPRKVEQVIRVANELQNFTYLVREVRNLFVQILPASR
ncbi:hypothetical protein BJ508DRAFT_414569 [Ascobolus immersus RN42]|uniref:Kinetochore protein SPC25 n=1 Tax=Ascobolus immersus RN42 TaxID=1160509 RepID=A0A3N4I8P9_ASCIM|nr:hypothetical protein BJ508DRAFT_414569 [Ascobolus immersus RN42]